MARCPDAGNFRTERGALVGRPWAAKGPEEHGGVGYWRRGLEGVERALWAAEERDRLYGREAERQGREDDENYLMWCSWDESAAFGGTGVYRTESEGFVKEDG